MLIESHKQVAAAAAKLQADLMPPLAAADKPKVNSPERDRGEASGRSPSVIAPVSMPKAEPPRPQPRSIIGLKEMLPAVRALANGGAGGGAGSGMGSSAATVKALPMLQQLALLAASLAVAGSDAAAAATREAEEAGFSAASTSYAIARAKKKANPFSEATGTAVAAGSEGPSAAAAALAAVKAGIQKPAKGILSGDAALRIPVRQVCHSEWKVWGLDKIRKAGYEEDTDVWNIHVNRSQYYKN